VISLSQVSRSLVWSLHIIILQVLHHPTISTPIAAHNESCCQENAPPTCSISASSLLLDQFWLITKASSTILNHINKVFESFEVHLVVSQYPGLMPLHTYVCIYDAKPIMSPFVFKRQPRLNQSIRLIRLYPKGSNFNPVSPEEARSKDLDNST
jgi:hypothetical protein